MATFRCNSCPTGCELKVDKIPYKDRFGGEMVKIKCPFDFSRMDKETGEFHKMEPQWEIIEQ